tara:strand:- start:1746 stop:2006 length:261 start_codon:yes stop_codon:yes gene_type:complete
MAAQPKLSAPWPNLSTNALTIRPRLQPIRVKFKKKRARGAPRENIETSNIKMANRAAAPTPTSVRIRLTINKAAIISNGRMGLTKI